MQKITETTKLSIFNSIVMAFMTMLNFFLAIHFVNIGFSGLQIGIIFAIGTITTILTTLPSGFGSDKFKAKKLITISLILISLFYLGLATTNNFTIIAIISFIAGIGRSIYKTSTQSLFYKSANNQEVTKKIGIFQGLNYLLIGLGMAAAGLLLETQYTFETLFLAVGLAFLVLTIISQIILPENKITEFKILNYKSDILQKKVIFFLIVILLFSLHFGAEATTYSLFLQEYLNLSSLYIGLYMGSAIAVMSLTTFLISKNIRKIPTKSLLLIGLLLSGIGNILMIIKPAEISFIFRTIHEIGDAAIFFFLYYRITQLFDLRRIGGNAGIFTFISTMGMTIGALTFSPMGEFYGYHIPQIVGGITTLTALSITLLYPHLIHK